jgi:dynein light intermediate chain 2
VVLVGCKFDLYEKYETENRRWLSKAIRYLAHVNNTSLAFSSNLKNSPIGGQLRSFMHELMFEEKPKIVCQRDHLKPIYIYRNQDTLNNIAVPSSGSLSGLEVLRRQLGSLFGAE